MNNSQRQLRLLNLVRKLLKLGRSNSNAHEAGLALQRAQKLMARSVSASLMPALHPCAKRLPARPLRMLKKFRNGW